MELKENECVIRDGDEVIFSAAKDPFLYCLWKKACACNCKSAGSNIYPTLILGIDVLAILFRSLVDL